LGNHDVSLVTNFGTIELRTLNWHAPVTADNFLRYVEANFYDRVIFHRSIANFMIQAGYWELQEDGRRVERKEGGDSIRNESRYSLSNRRGTLSMARTSDPDSASTQFFINQANNSFLNYGSSENPDGYTVFARLISGLDVVDAINAIPTGNVSGIGSDVPVEVVIIESVTLQQ
jgi:peptidyl-prolyl cis-trans isomerase A (cyclophilin A)